MAECTVKSRSHHGEIILAAYFVTKITRPTIPFASALLALCLLAAACTGQGSSPPANSATPTQPPTATAPAAPGADASRPTSPPSSSARDLQPYAAALRPSHRNDIDAFATANRYDIELTVEPETQRVTGRQTVQYTNRGETPLQAILLRLYPNTSYMSGQMRVADVRVNGHTITPSVYLRQTPGLTISITDTSVLSLPLLTPLAAGHSTSLSMTFEVTAPVDTPTGYRVFGLTNGVLSLPNVYPMIPIHDAAGWRVDEAPAWGDIVFSEVALYRVQIRAPASQVIVATGTCDTAEGATLAASETPRPTVTTMPNATPTGNQQTMTCSAGPVREFALHLSSQFQITQAVVTSQGEPIIVTSYYLPASRLGGERALTYAAEAMHVYERRFGAYPFRELKVFMSPTTSGGIEYPTLAGVTDSLYGIDGGYFEWITAHEVAHQWWYSLVGSDPVNEAWLDEALTQYATSLYIEDRYGQQAAQAERNRYFSQRYEEEVRRPRLDTRVGQATGSFTRKAYGPVVYGKGPLFFQAVREAAGDARFNSWLRAYFNRYRYGVATAEDLLRMADETGIGLPARQAYQEWILGASRPD